MGTGRICFTFDDGNLSTFTEVFPLLRQAGMKGHIAVVTDYVGREDKYSWDQVAEMAAAGWEVMSHSRTHDFKAVDKEKMRSEVVGSREILQERGFPARIFNMPGGPWSGESRFAPGSDFEALVRRTYDAFLPDRGIHPFTESVDRYSIGHICCECYGVREYERPLPEILSSLDEAARTGTFCQLLWHDVRGDYLDKFRRVLARVVPLVREGRLENVTLSDGLLS